MDDPTPRSPSMWPLLDPSALASIDTPTVVVDLDRLHAAIERMAGSMRTRGVALRPHAKTHKSLEIGRLQVAAGASGLTVGTLGEAEVFAAAGMTDLFIAYPLVPRGPKAARLEAVGKACGGRLRIGLDSTTGAAAIATALGGPSAAGSTRVEVLVEIDSGGRRSGVAPLAAGRLAAAAADLGLDVIGVFTHGGHGYAGRDIRAAAADDEVHALETAAVSLAQAGIEPRVISAGSTPTAVASARGVVTEERPGTYVLGDRQQVALGSIERDAVAAFIAGTVVSVDADGGRFVVDAGAKILAKDVADYVAGHGSVVPLAGSGALEAVAAGVEAVVSRIYDYHGVVQLPDGSAMPSVGEVVAVVPNHICPVVNLVDHLVIVQAGRIIGHWPVNARGRNG